MRHHDFGNLYVQFEVEFPKQHSNPLNRYDLEVLKKVSGLPYLEPEDLAKQLEVERKERMMQFKKDKEERRKEAEREKLKRKRAQEARGMVLDDQEDEKTKKQRVHEEAEFERIAQQDAIPELQDIFSSNPTPPPRTAGINNHADPAGQIIRDDVYLEEVDPTGQQRANGATMEDEEEDGMPQGGERVQCASQ
jgi:hypothetical protein